MGKAIPIVIGEFSFSSKSDARNAVRELIGRFGFSEKLNSSDKDFCLQLFKRHSEYEEKIQCGIKDIEVRKDVYGNKYFHLLRTDGSDDDISWVHCIYPKR